MENVKVIRLIRLDKDHVLKVGLCQGHRILTYHYSISDGEMQFNFSMLCECNPYSQEVFRSNMERLGYKTESIEVDLRPWFIDRIIASPVKADLLANAKQE